MIQEVFKNLPKVGKNIPNSITQKVLSGQPQIQPQTQPEKDIKINEIGEIK